MPRYASEEELYADLGATLRAAAADSELGAKLKGADAVIQHRLSEPSATVTLDARASREPRVELGETSLVPDVVMSMSSDTAHALWTGQLQLVRALASGEIAAKGPVGRVLKHLGLAGPLSGRYEDLKLASDAEPAETAATTEDEPSDAEVVPDPDAVEDAQIGDDADTAPDDPDTSGEPASG
jgi:hypothetical protein